MNAFLYPLWQRAKSTWLKYLLGVLCLVTALSSQTGLKGPWLTFALFGLSLWLLKPLVKGWGSFLGWGLCGVWLLGAANADPATRSIVTIGALIALLASWTLWRIIGHLKR